jgi:hypothetical protein
MFTSKWNTQVLKVKCPVCRRGNGHMCRDAQGKCLPISHPERRKAALELTVGAFRKTA